MMKKKTLMFLALSVLVAMTGVMVNAWANGNYEGQLDNNAIWEGEFSYTVTSLNPNTDPMEATVTVVANNLPRETTTAINIPDDFTKYVKGTYNGKTIEGNVKFTVNAIGDDAFADLPNVKEIEIPAGIETIGVDGFDNLGNLKTVTFAPGSKLKSIGNYTFGISKIEEVDFSNCADLDLCGTIPFMPRGANPVNNQLKKVTLPTGMKCIGTAFANCPQLAEINLENTAIEEIPEGAFEGDASLTSLTLPALAPGKTLKIGPNAFCGTGITELTINSDLGSESLTPASFAGIALQSLTINGKLIGAGAIPAGVFAEKCNDKWSKNSLKTLVFNGKIVAENAIATDAVKGLTSLETLTFSQIAKNGIAEGAFQENVNTASGKAATITFNGVLGQNAIGKEAFKGSDFKKIVFAEDLDAASIGEGAFMNTTRDGEAVVEFQGILGAAGAVGKDAFKGSDVTKVEFKQSIIQAGAIAESAFEGADQLSEILFDASLNETDAVAANAFKSAGNNATLYVGSINASQAINSSAFDGASIKFVTFDALNVTEAIAPNQFKSDVALNELTINGDLKKENIIGASAFDGTVNLGKIKLTGNILVADAIKGTEGSEPFNGAGANKATTLDLKSVDQIVAGGIGEYAFAQSGINTIELNSSASNIAQEAFVANSFLNIPQKAVIKYNPAQSNIKGHSFNQEAFAPAYQNVDIKFQTNAFVQRAYEIAENNADLTPWRIKFMLNIELTLETQGSDGYYYTVWAPQDEMYYIEKYQENGATITVYSAYFDDLSLNKETIGDPAHPEDNVVYFNPLRLQADGKYVLNADEAMLIKSTKPFTVANPLQAKQNIKDDSMEPLYPFGGIQTFAGLNVRQCNDLRYSPWQIYTAAYYNNREDWYGNILSDYELFRLDKPETMPFIYNAHGVPANGLYILATNDRVKRGKYSGGYEESWIAKYQASEALKAAVIATLEMTGEPTNQQIIDELVKQIANKDLDPTVEATLNAEIERLNGLEAKHIKLLVDLIKAQKAIDEAEEQLTQAENSDANVNPFAVGALRMAYANFIDAVNKMNGYTLGVIYLAADRAYDSMKDYYDAQKAYEDAYKAWTEAHDAYIAKATKTENTDPSKTENVDFIPVKVLSNIDADGNEIKGFVDETYYIKATDEILAILTGKGFTLPAKEEAAGARRMATSEPSEESSEPEEEEFNILSERVQLYSKAEAETETSEEPATEPLPEPAPGVVSGARIVGLQGEAEEIGDLTATGIYVEIGEIEYPEADYFFRSYGYKTNWQLLVEQGPEMVPETAVINGVERPIYLGSDGKKYWGLVSTGDNIVQYREWLGGNDNVHAELADESITMTASMIAKNFGTAAAPVYGFAKKAVEGDPNYSFTSYGDAQIAEESNKKAGATALGTGLVAVTDKAAGSFTVQVIKNTPEGFNGNTYKVNADAEADGLYELFTTGETSTSTGMWADVVKSSYKVLSFKSYSADDLSYPSGGTTPNGVLASATPWAEGTVLIDAEQALGTPAWAAVRVLTNVPVSSNLSAEEAATFVNATYYLNLNGYTLATAPAGVYELYKSPSPGHYANTGIWVDVQALSDGLTVYEFYSYAADQIETKKVLKGDPEAWATGMAYIDKTQTPAEGGYYTVEVKENSVDGFVGNKYLIKVEGDIAKAENGLYELLDETTKESTGIWVNVESCEYYYSKSATGEGGFFTDLACTKALEEEEVEGEKTNIWAVGCIDASDKKELGGKEYYPVKVLSNFAVEYSVNTTYNEETGEKIETTVKTVTDKEIEGFVGETFYVAAEDVEKDGEIATEAEGIQLLSKYENNTYPTPVEWKHIYIDYKPVPGGDFAFRSFGKKYNSWDDGKEDIAFAQGTVQVVLDKEAEGKVVAVETAEIVLEETPNGTYTYTPAFDAAAAEFAALAELTKALNNAAQDLAEKSAKVEGMDNADAATLEELQTAANNADGVVTQRTTALTAAMDEYDRIYQECKEAFEREADGTNFLEFMATEYWHNRLATAQAAVDNAQMQLYQAQFNANMAHAAVAHYLKEKANTELLANVRDELFDFIMENTTSWTDSEGNEHLKAEYGDFFGSIHVEQAALLNYIAAKQALENAQKGYDAAQESANEAAIEAAEQALTNAKAQFDAAMEAINADDNEHQHVASSEARKINVVFNDGNDTVGIMEAVVANGSKAVAGEGAIYNLQGIRVNKASKGVFIQNGVKVIK